ncbi:LysE family transporter [bacterium]|nr:LysE family transporter [bacterium]
MGIAAGAFIIALSGAMMPGPLLTITISESIKRGKWTGAFMILGHSILELGLMLLILAGFDHLFKTNKTIGIISLIGGIILLWMGWDTIRKAKGVSLSYKSEIQGKSCYGPVLTGIFASISNPYWSIWWATIGIGYMAASLIYGWIGIAAFFTGHISADFAWYTLISFSVAGGKRFISNRIYHGVLVACGGILFLFGIIFLHMGLRKMGIY